MKAPRKNAGKAVTKRTKLLPDGAGTAVKPDPKPVPALFTARLFPKEAITSPEYDFGPILTPEQMAEKVPPGGRWKEMTLDALAAKALAALVGYGPKQPAPHLQTAEALARGLAALRDFALAGDLDAMRSLGLVLTQAVADLAELARRKPNVVREWSRTQNVVPVLTGRNIGHRKQLVADLDLFAVGEATPYRVNPPKGKKAPDISTSANALAGQLCKHLADHRAISFFLQRPVPVWARLAAKLPPLSKAVWEPWADAAWECLMSATGSHPETDPKLASLGQKAKVKHDKLRKQAAEIERLKRRSGLVAPNRPLHTSNVTPAAIRAEIQQTLREAIRNLAQVTPAPYSE